jgi:hypothetical protein
LRVFKTKELRRIFRPKKDKLTEGWKKIIYSDQMMDDLGAIHTGRIKNACKILARKSQGKKPFSNTI